MSRQRQPVELLELKGSFQHDPQRRRPAGPKAKSPFGKAPDYFTAMEKTLWKELTSNGLPGVLTGNDRWLAEVACRMMAKLRSRDSMTASEMSALINAVGRLGLSPIDRQKITDVPGTSDSKEVSPYGEFTRSSH